MGAAKLSNNHHELIRILTVSVPPECLKSTFWDTLPQDSKASFRLLCKEACILSDSELISTVTVLLSPSFRVGDAFTLLQRLRKLATLHLLLSIDFSTTADLHEHLLVQLLSLGKYFQSVATVRLEGPQLPDRHQEAENDDEEEPLRITLEDVVLETLSSRLPRLKSLTLTHLGIIDGAISQLSSCQHLTQLCICHGQCGDSVSEEISHLQHLQHLEVKDIWLTTGIDLSPLQGLSSLQHLHLEDQEAIGFHGLGSMTQLTSLTLDNAGSDLDESAVEQEGAFLSSLTNLRQLTVVHCDLFPEKGTPYLSRLGQLTSLVFGMNGCRIDLDWHPDCPPLLVHLKKLVLLGRKTAFELHALLYMAPALESFQWDDIKYDLLLDDSKVAPGLTSERQLQRMAQRLVEVPDTVSGLSLDQVAISMIKPYLSSLTPLTARDTFARLRLERIKGVGSEHANAIADCLPKLRHLHLKRVDFADSLVLPSLARLDRLQQLLLTNCGGQICPGDVFTFAARQPGVEVVVKAVWWGDAEEQHLECVLAAAAGYSQVPAAVAKST